MLALPSRTMVKHETGEMEKIDDVPSSRKRSAEISPASCLLLLRRRRIRKISWSEKPEIRLHESPSKTFHDYDKTEIWYTREEYQEFLVDRLRTVQLLRASGGNERALDSETCCIRGLEQFQNPALNDVLNSQRQFHKSTVLIEQMRQSMLGSQDQERFRLMVGPQSEFSLRRAQQLAALDQHEVHGDVRKRPSSFLPSTATPCNSTSLPRKKSILVSKTTPKHLSIPASEACNDPMMLPAMSEEIRIAQQLNARRLIEMYSQPEKNPFRFTARRDCSFGSQSSRAMLGAATGFPIRRDSLTPLRTTGQQPS